MMCATAFCPSPSALSFQARPFASTSYIQAPHAALFHPLGRGTWKTCIGVSARPAVLLNMRGGCSINPTLFSRVLVNPALPSALVL